MHPILIDLGTFDFPVLGSTHVFLPTYGVLFALGVLVAWWWFARRAQTLELDRDRVFSLAFYSLLAGLFGAKLALVVVEWRYYLSNPMEIFGTLRVAGVLLGGVLAAIAVFLLYARYHRLPALELLDAGVAPLALAQSVGRLGCFSAGCCWGVGATSGFAVTFTNPVANAQTGVPLNTPLVPVQLIQAANDLTLAIVLSILWRRRPRPAGTVLWCYLFLYGLTRGIIEFWRGDDVRGLYFGGVLSTSQIIGIAVMVLALIMLVRGRVQASKAGAE